MQHSPYARHGPIAETVYTNSYNAVWKGLGWALTSEKLVLSIFEFPVSSQVLYRNYLVSVCGLLGNEEEVELRRKIEVREDLLEKETQSES